MMRDDAHIFRLTSWRRSTRHVHTHTTPHTSHHKALVSDGIEGILLGAHVINDNSAIVEKNDAPVNYPGAWKPHKAYALRKHGFFVPPVTGKAAVESSNSVIVERKFAILLFCNNMMREDADNK